MSKDALQVLAMLPVAGPRTREGAYVSEIAEDLCGWSDPVSMARTGTALAEIKRVFGVSAVIGYETEAGSSYALDPSVQERARTLCRG